MTAAYLFSPDFADEVDRGRTERGWESGEGQSCDPSRPADEAALLSGLAAGDERAFAALFRTYTPQMYRVAAALLGSGDAAADVVQGVMHRLWLQRAALTIRGTVGAYLRAATVNAVKNVIRGETRARASAERAAVELAPLGRDAPTEVADDEEETMRRAIILERAIARLPDRTREIFLLWWGGRLSYAEIAHATGISVKGVERARARALDALRTSLIEAGLGPRRRGA